MNNQDRFESDLKEVLVTHWSVEEKLKAIVTLSHNFAMRFAFYIVKDKETLNHFIKLNEDK